MEIMRATEFWQKTGAYYVRIEAMVKEFHLDISQEFDDHDNHETEYVVAFDNGIPVGTCRLFLKNDTTAHIERVCVLEEYRNQGLGGQIIQEAERWLKDKSVQKIVITSREEAVSFYEKLGYTADYNRTWDGGIFKIIYTYKII